MILADTSAWVEFDRATESPVDRRLTGLIESAGPLAITEPVVMEVLAGARDRRREEDLRRLLARFSLIHVESVADFEGAARIYRRSRAAGVTPRGLIDCMIVAVALRAGAALLACDRDIELVAGVVGVEIDQPSA